MIRSCMIHTSMRGSLVPVESNCTAEEHDEIVEGVDVPVHTNTSPSPISARPM